MTIASGPGRNFPAATMIKLIQKLARSETVRKYLADFRRITGLSVSFRSNAEHEVFKDFAMCRNPFCALVRKTPEGEALCRDVHAQAEERAHRSGEPARAHCPFSLCTLAFPVTVPNGRDGTVFAGEVLLRPPDKAKLSEELKHCLGEKAAGPTEFSQLWDAYCRTPVLTREQFRKLARMFEGVVEEMRLTLVSARRAEATRTQHEIDQAIAVLEKHPDVETHVKTRAAERILLENLTIQIGMHVRYLRLKNLGLGVYSVSLADPDARPQTLLLK